MIGFDPLTLSAAYIAASLSTAECQAPGHVAVNVEVVQTENPVVTGLAPGDMNDKRVDMDSSGVTDGQWIKGGATLTRGMALKEGIDVEFNAEPKGPQSACLTPKKINYTITFSPVVYIAAGLSPCVSKATLAHEQRHVDRDRAIIDAYVPILEKALTDYVDGLPAPAPEPSINAESAKDQLANSILQAIKPKWGDLSYAVRKGQADVDTPEDYKRDTAACPGEFPPYDGPK